MKKSDISGLIGTVIASIFLIVGIGFITSDDMEGAGMALAIGLLVIGFTRLITETLMIIEESEDKE
jgi:hypothetical protein